MFCQNQIVESLDQFGEIQLLQNISKEQLPN